MFIPFLAATAVAAAFAKLGAMSVQIAVLTLALQALSVAFLAAAVISAIVLLKRRQRQ